MRLRQIAINEEDNNQELSDAQLLELHKLAEKVEKVHSVAIKQIKSTGLGQILQDPERLYRTAITIAASDWTTEGKWDPIENQSTSIAKLSSALITLNDKIVKDPRYEAKGIKKKWTKTVNDVILASIENTQKRHAELGGQNINEGLIRSFFEMFTKVGSFLVKTIAAGITIGGHIAAEMIKSGQGSYYPNYRGYYNQYQPSTRPSSKNKEEPLSKAKKETPKKETPKKETPKKETLKKETLNKETPKKETPKKETPIEDPIKPKDDTDSAEQPVTIAPITPDKPEKKPKKYNIYNAEFVGEIFDSLTSYDGLDTILESKKPADQIFKIFQDILPNK
jgi:hypothetical protein